MAFNGSGTFLRIRNWTNDAIAGIKIRADRHDAEDDNFASGLSQCITKDGQTTITANLPMATYRHTNVGSAVNVTDYARYDQVQLGKAVWAVAGGTADAITATYSPSTTTPVDGQLYFVRAGYANATATPTFSPDGQTARTVVREGGDALLAGDIAGAGHELILRYNLANTRYELLNPAKVTSGSATDGQVLTADGSGGSDWEDLPENELPIGSIYMNASVSTNPSTLLGYGTWVAIQNRMIIGAGGSYSAGATGGSATTTQTTSTLASHTHSLNVIASANPGGSTTHDDRILSGSGSTTSGSTGSGSAMTTISPYYGAYIWRRTA